jgi:hypothetical protein
MKEDDVKRLAASERNVLRMFGGVSEKWWKWYNNEVIQIFKDLDYFSLSE